MPFESDTPKADWDRDFLRLRERYARKLQQQLATLDEMLREARQTTPTAAPLDVARQLAHRLKGTSGTYELQASFAALEQIEEQIELLLEAAPHAGLAWARIEEALERARKGLILPLARKQ